MNMVFTLLSGILFGLGLAYSDMINPHTVLAFLTFQDLGLLLVLGFAVVINLIVFNIFPRIRSKPVYATTFEKRPFSLNKTTLAGGAIFGLGWGICGICPAPAFAGLGAGNLSMLIVLISIFMGAWLHGLYMSRTNK